MRSWRLFLAALCLLGGGCADAKGRFQDFEDRAGTQQGEAGARNDGAAGAANDGECHPPAPGVVHGFAVLALETSALPGSAILFFGQIDTPELGGNTAVKFEYRALDATDRQTQVGERLVVGPYEIAADGSFEAPTAESTLPGSANAILPGVPITSELTLHGTICGVTDFYCGTVSGTVSSPIAGPTSGQFGLTLVPSLEDMPPRPRFGCADDALAPPLADD